MALDQAFISQIEQAIISKMQAIAYVLSGWGVLIAGFSVNDWAAVISAACAFVTCVAGIGINFYFKLRAARRSENE